MSVSGLRIASAPVSFGVDEVMTDDAWVTAPDDMLDWMVDIGFEGTELGDPGYLGDGPQVRERLSSRRLELVGAFLPQHFSRTEKADEDRAWLRDTLRLIADGSPAGSRPFAVLADHFDEPVRQAYSGRIREHPEAWLDATSFRTLVDSLHRAAETCRAAGLEPVIHPHAGTYIETADEIARLVDAMDPSIVGLCLDTGHFRFGGADPVAAAGDYRDVIRHVHVKDCRSAVIDQAREEDLGLREALARGVFCALGEGDARIDAVVARLMADGYRGWLVIEQDQQLRSSDTPASVKAGQLANREYLRRLGL